MSIVKYSNLDDLYDAASSAEVDSDAIWPITVDKSGSPTTKYMTGEILKEVIRDEFGENFLTEGANVTITHDDGANTVTVAVTSLDGAPIGSATASTGSFTVNTVDQLVFDITAAIESNAAGEMSWDEDAETVMLALDDQIHMHIGQDSLYHVLNQTGSDIAKGTAVYATGTVGNSGKITIAPFTADGTYDSKYFMGVTAEAITNGSTGFVVHFGKIRQLNTNAFEEGDILYADPSTAGGLTNVRPAAPNNIITVAIVVTKSATVGELFVRPTFVDGFADNEDVTITSATTGDLLRYNGTIWVNYPDSNYASATGLSTHIADTTNPHSVTKTQVGLSNVENTALSTWAGSANITTLGTIGAGTWQGTAIANDYVAGIDQNLLQASSPTFAGLTVTGANDALLSVLNTQTAFDSEVLINLAVTSNDANTNPRVQIAGVKNGTNGGSLVVRVRQTDILNDALTIANSGAATFASTVSVDSDLTLASGSITSASGAISFGNENLSTTGTLASGAATVTGTATVNGDFNVDINSTGTIARFNGSGFQRLDIASEADTTVLDFRNVTNIAFRRQGSDIISLTSSGATVTGTLTATSTVQGTTLTSTNGTISTVMSYSTVGIIGTQSNHDLHIRTNGTPALTLDSSQNATFAGVLNIEGDVLNVDSVSATRISGGAGTGDGGNILLYGGSHATLAGDYTLRSGTTAVNSYDASAGLHTLVGDLTLSAGDLEVRGADATITVGLSSAGSGKLKLVESGLTGFQFHYDGSANQLYIGSGGADSFTTRVTIDRDTGDTTFNTGDVTLSSGDLTVNGTDLLVQNASNPKLFVLETGAGGVVVQGTGSGGRVYSNTGQKLLLGANGQNAHATIDTSGNFLLGATSTSLNAQFYSKKAYGNASGSDMGAWFYYDQSVGTTGSLTGTRMEVRTTHTSGTVARVQAATSYAQTTGSGGTTTDIIAHWFRTVIGAGSTATTAYSIKIDDKGRAGTITNGWALHSEDVDPSYLAGDLRIGTTSATSHGQEGLRVNTSNDLIANFHNGSGIVSSIQLTHSATGTGSTDGLEIGISGSNAFYDLHEGAGQHRFVNSIGTAFAVASDAYAIGIGTTDVESWDNSFGVIEFGESAIMAGNNQDSIWMLSNAYFDGSWKRKVVGEAAQYVINADGSTFQWQTAGSSTADSTITWSEKMRLTNDGMLLVGDTANTGMTVGLTINQGANDDEILAFKSSDVAHGMTSVTETDTYGVFSKLSATTGGLKVIGIGEDAGTQASLALQAWGGTADTGKTSSGIGLVNIYVTEHNGAGSQSDITANGNVLSVRGRVGAADRTLFLIDEDGDFLYDGADGGAFDTYQDAHLVRAFANATSKNTLRTAHDDWVQYNEDTLVEIGVLGAPVSEGGLINGAQLQRVHTGAIWQNYMAISDTKTEVEVLRDRLADTESRLAIAESKLKQLPAA